MQFRHDVHGTRPSETEFNYGSVYLRANVRETTAEDGRIEYVYDEWFMPYEEYEMIQQGRMPSTGVWDAMTHKVFREYQHSRTDDLYAYAQRMLRTTEDPGYATYITALDQWNAQVSALASTLSTDVPDLPTI